MKRIFVILIIAIVFVGCKKEKSVDVVINDGHEYVDLGLPSGTLWATCNVGANRPEEVGDYFAWGETATKDIYDWKHYKFGILCTNVYKLTKYCNNPTCGYNGYVDNLSLSIPSNYNAMILLVRFQKLHKSAHFALVCAKVLNAIRHLNGRVGFWYAKINFNTLTIIF